MSDYDIIDVSNCFYTINYENYYFGISGKQVSIPDYIQSKTKLDQELVLNDNDTYWYIRGIYIKYKIEDLGKITVHGTFNVYKKFDNKDEFIKELT